MLDDLPEAVFAELGRVTWAAIKLEDYTEDVCERIDPRWDPGHADMRQLGRRVKDATRALAARPPSAARDTAAAWLRRASKAIDRRNAALHATPIVWTRNEQLGLGEMPWGDRPYAERPLTVDSLSELRSTLEDAASGWRDLVLALAAESGKLNV